MKKITFLAILMVSILTNAQVVLNEDFEGSPFVLPTDWDNVNLDPFGDASHVWTLENSGDAYYVTTGPNTYMYTIA